MIYNRVYNHPKILFLASMQMEKQFSIVEVEKLSVYITSSVNVLGILIVINACLITTRGKEENFRFSEGEK
jgi:hypothetical protein